MTLREVVSNFINKLWNTTKEILGFGLTLPRAELEQLVESRLSPIYDEMFRLGQEVDYAIVEKNVGRLVKDYKVPIKYNKALLQRIQSESVFTGYFDKNWSDLYTRKEIDKIKRIILTAKYNGTSEGDLKKLLMGEYRMSEKRALIVARGELQRLEVVAAEIYNDEANVKAEYDLMWQTAEDDRVRPAHARMNGKLADKDGYFDSPDWGKIKTPADIPYPGNINCRCKTVFVKKDKS